MTRWNLTGIIMLVAAFVVTVVMRGVGVPERWAVTFAFGAVAVFDLAMRLTSDVVGRAKWLGGQGGGILVFIPAWIISALLSLVVASGLLGAGLD